MSRGVLITHIRDEIPFGVASVVCYIPVPFSPESSGGERQRPSSVPASCEVGGHNNTLMNPVFRGMVRQLGGLLTKENCGKYRS